VLNSIEYHYLENEIVKFLVVLEKAQEGGYNVTVPALDGCFTQGETEEDAVANAREAILCYLEGLEKVNQIKATPGLRTREVEVAV
jgi:predicted RNase H-like HicB family nuclease